MLGKLSYYRDPILRLECEEVTKNDDLNYMVGRMTFLMKRHDGIGLAANQAGFNKRLFIYDIGDGIKTILNPVIVHVPKLSVEQVQEGCLSMPNFFWKVPRANTATVRYHDTDFVLHMKVFHGLEAQVWQHEVNHLNGRLIVDYLSEEELEKFERKWKTKKHF